MASTLISPEILLLFSLCVAAAAQRALWCVAKNNADDASLQSALDWACGPGGADCGPIQKGGPCYDTSDLQRTASYAFNDYYLKHGNSDDACSFSNTAAVTSLNPSHGNCKFRSSLSTSNGNSSDPAGSATADLTSSSSSCISRCLWFLWGSILALSFIITPLL